FISSAPATSRRASPRRATSTLWRALPGGRPSRRPSTTPPCLTTLCTASPPLRRSDPTPPDLHPCRSGGVFLSPQGHGTVTIKVFCPTGLTPPSALPYVQPIAPDERTRTGTGGRGTTARWYADGGSRGGNPCPPLDLRSASPSTPRSSREARSRR